MDDKLKEVWDRWNKHVQLGCMITLFSPTADEDMKWISIKAGPSSTMAADPSRKGLQKISTVGGCPSPPHTAITKIVETTGRQSY